MEDYSDSLAPNDGELIHQIREERDQEEGEERAVVQAATPYLEKVFEWFDTEIAAANTLDGLDFERQVSMETQIMARQMFITLMRNAKSRLENQASEWVK